MKLSSLIDFEKDKKHIIKYENFLPEFEVEGFADNSRDTNINNIFIARIGSVNDGHDYILDAQKNEKKVFILSDESKKIHSACNIIVKDTNAYLLILLQRFYNNLPKNIYGVTGTNGKTSIVSLSFQLMCKLKKPSAFIGTMGVKLFTSDFEYKNISSNLTTPGIIDVYRILSELKYYSIDDVFMEVSSHAIDQERIKGINFCQKIFTNLSIDHLDYHKTMDNYFNTKASFFENDENAKLIINLNQYGKLLANRVKKNNCCLIIDQTESDIINKGDQYSYNRFGDHLCLIKKDINKDGIKFEFTYLDKKYSLNIKQYGEYYIFNFLTVIFIFINMRIFKIDDIIKSIEQLETVDGRLELIYDQEGKYCFVDYAHTPDALEKSLLSLKMHGFKDIILVFGCGGDRDKSKRKLMGEIANENAKITIVTDDNPRNEEPSQIRNEIKSMIDNPIDIGNRKNAIKEAILRQKQNKYVILIAGKGHEDYQIIKDKKIDFSDKKNALEFYNDI